MSNQQDRGYLFSALRQLLKNKGLTYRDLAKLMEISEPTVKRLFQEKDCKLSRILEICDLLNTEFNELLKMGSELQQRRGTVLSEDTEKYLATHKSLASFFILLINSFEVEQIAELNQLSKSDVYQYLRELEKLGLIQLLPNHRMKFIVSLPIRWRINGVMSEILISTNKKFITQLISEYDPNEKAFFTSNRLLSRDSIEYLKEQLELIYQQYQYRANLDQSFYPKEDLLSYKLILALKSFDIQNHFPISSFEKS